jgi:hypothetical protein
MDRIGQIAARQGGGFVRSTYPGAVRARAFCKKGGVGEQNESGLRQAAWPFESSKARPQADEGAGGGARKVKSRDQVAAGFLGFVDLLVLALLLAPVLALTGLRDVAGLMPIGAPAGAAAASSGPGLKYTRHSGESCDLFLTMQAVTRSTSGISGPQSRNASLLQAACSSWV